MIATRILPLLLVALAGCATNGGLRRVETQVAVLRVESARRDSARAVELDRIIAIQERVLDSLVSTQQALRSLRTATAAELTDINRQLVQIQELTGQSQQNLNRLRADLEARSQAMQVIPPGGSDSGGIAAPSPSANQMYQAARLQYSRGSLSTARMAYHAYLGAWPDDAQVPDALHGIGDTWRTENPDSAVAYFSRVVAQYPAAAVAPTALYKIGLIAEDRNDLPAARAAYQRVIREYPRADDVVGLATARLNALRP